MPLKKIDEQGNYTQFPGFTVVARVRKEELSFWQEIYKCVVDCELGRKYYSPLPFESYHMTSTNLFTQQVHGGRDWYGFIKGQQPFFKRLQEELTDCTFSPQITIEEMAIAGAIQLVLSLPEDQKKIIHRVAQKFNIEHEVPAVFHITLAYQYKGVDRVTLEAIRNQINHRLSGIFPTHPINLSAPQLCYFDDMTAFVPWNGEEHLEKEHDSRLFSKIKKNSDKDDKTPGKTYTLK